MIRLSLLAPLLPALLWSGCRSESAPSSAPAGTSAEAAPTLRLPGDVRPTDYQLALDLDPTQARFSGRATIAVQLDRPRQQLWLHGRSLHVTSATVTPAGGAPIAARWEEQPHDGFARLALPRSIGPGAVTLELAWDAPFNGRLEGLYKARESGIDYIYTQMEAIGARYAFPCFDEPLFKTPFTVELTVPATDVAVANTLAVAETALPGGKKRVRFATSKPLPTYLVALAVGPFDVVEHAPLPPNEVRKRPLPMRGITPKGRGAEIAAALDAAAGLLPAEERYFGIEYPYDKLDHIAVPDFAFGAMENAGAITYREPDVLYVEGRTPFTRKREMIDAVAHEMAHQWFGDLVTLRWWTDAWLNESFATWMSARTIDRWDARAHEGTFVQYRANEAMAVDALAAARAIHQPVKVTGDIWAQFDNLTYQKGAAVLAMLEGWIGADAFRRGLHDYLSAHAWGGGSSDDLVAAFSQAAGRDVAPAFASFIEQPGVPLVRATLSCEGGAASLALQQSRFLPLGSTAKRDGRWLIPVCVRYGSGATAQSQCTLLTAAQGTLPLGAGCPEWVMPNAGGVGYYRWALGPRELAALTKSWARLAPRERLSFAYNVVAAMNSGDLAAADGLRALAAPARDRDSFVAAPALQALEEAHDRLVDPELRPRVASYAEALYRPALQRLGFRPQPDEDAPTRALRRDLVEVLALVFRDPAVRAQALARGRALLDVAHGTLQLDAVDPELRAPVLGVRLQEEGAPLFDALVAQLDRTPDVTLHEQLVSSLFLTTDKTLYDRALTIMIGPQVPRGSREEAVYDSARLWDNRRELLAWLPAHVDTLIANMSADNASELPHVFASLVEPKQAEAVRALFTPELPKVGSLDRSLAETEEAIVLGAAYVAKQRASANGFFRAPPTERVR